MAQITDPVAIGRRDVTGEHRSKAAEVLAEVARMLATKDTEDRLSSMGFAVLVGARAYDQAGRSCHGGGQNVSRMALRAVAELTGLERGDVPTGTTRQEFAVTVAQAARALGYDWSGVQAAWSDDANERAIPRHPVPGPRKSDESGRVPAPRPEQAVAR
ncbi:hypothetical protein ABTY98_05190 [Streptomyces sp. NPDC096040]|uniref:hypothetical protein n=1 Tax=Streptomyces sp. NPDC096040 TaxID=3155541 RepID=UPI00331C9B2E